MRQPGAEPWLAAATGAASLAVSLPRLCPTLSLMGDSAAFAAAGASWGIAQPPGYPLWTLLAHGLYRLPLGEPAWRLHLSSALFHATAVALVAALIQRCTGSRAAAVGGALTLAFSRAFLLGSLYAEVFPLNDLFVALLLLLALHFAEAPDTRSKRRALVALAVGCGLASAHHQTIVLAAPALAVVLARGDWRLLRDPRIAARLLLGFAAPLLACFGLLWLAASRDPAASWGDVRELGELWRLATRQDYGGPFSPFLGERGDGALAQLGEWTASFHRSFGVLGGLLVVVGVAWLARHRPWLALALALGTLASGPLFAVANALPVAGEHGRAFAERFTTMSHVLLAPFAGAGIAWLEQLAKVPLPPRLAALAAAALGVVPLLSRSELDLSGDRRGEQAAIDLIEHADDGALLLFSGDALNGAAAWRCGVERRCGRRVAFSPGQLHMPWRVRQLARRHPDLVLPVPAGSFITVRELVAANLPSRPVFLTALLLEREPALRDAFQYLPEGVLLRVLPSPPGDAARARFVASARRLLRGEACAGCAMRAADLVRPSLETALVQGYVDAAVNHARMLRAFFDEPALAAELEAVARRIDPAAARAYGIGGGAE
jgi:hypothetical protein